MHTLPPPQPVAHSVNCTSCHFLHLYRNIKGFMVQTGDPTGERWGLVLLGLAGTCVCVCHCTGTGKGGQSIWGGRFEDEFHDSLKVCSPVSAS